MSPGFGASETTHTRERERERERDGEIESMRERGRERERESQRETTIVTCRVPSSGSAEATQRCHRAPLVACLLLEKLVIVAAEMHPD